MARKKWRADLLGVVPSHKYDGDCSSRAISFSFVDILAGSQTSIHSLETLTSSPSPHVHDRLVLEVVLPLERQLAVYNGQVRPMPAEQASDLRINIPDMERSQSPREDED